MTERTVLVRLRANADQFQREMVRARTAVKGLRDEIDTTNDRTAWMVQGFLALAPALAPLGAAAVPMLAGIATQATIGVGAIGTMALAFSGLGDALGALNDYQLEPTAENLAKLDEALVKIGPDGAEFVRFLDEAGGKLRVLQMDARAGMFPGMQQGIESFLTRLPELRAVVQEIAGGIGQLAAEAGAGIAGDEFTEFFEYLRTDARPILVEMGRTIGNFIDGFASMIVAFNPATQDFSRGLLQMSRDFEQWAEGLESSQSFQEFLAYIEESGPKAIDLLGSIVDALVQLAIAAAPIGDAILPVLTELFEILGAIAGTPVGQIAIVGAALTSLYGRLAALRRIAGGPVFGALTRDMRGSATAARVAAPSMRQWGNALIFAAHNQRALNSSLTSGSRIAQQSARRAIESRNAVAGFARAAGPAAAGAALLATAMSPLPEKFGLTNTTMGALIGMMGGPWGVAAGATIGAIVDMNAANDDLLDSLDAAEKAMERGAGVPELQAHIDNLLAKAEDLNDITGFGDFFGDALNGAGEGAEYAVRQAELLANRIQTIQEFSDDWSIDGLRDVLVGPIDDASSALWNATLRTREWRRELERLFGVLDRQEAIDAYEAAIDAARKAAKEFGDDLRSTTEAGRGNRAALREIARSALEVAENMQGTNRVRFLLRARGDLIDAYQRLGLSRQEARRLADNLLQLDKLRIRPNVDVQTERARRKAREVLDDLDLIDDARVNPWANFNIDPFMRDKEIVDRNLDGLDDRVVRPEINVESNAQAAASATEAALNNIDDEWVYIRVQRLGAQGAGPARINDGTGADGARVPKDGGPYFDRFHWLVAPGEAIISNRRGQVDQSERLLGMINEGLLTDRDLARLQGAAEGGAGQRAWEYQRPTEARVAGRVAVSVGDLRVTGKLNTPWGPAEVEGIARAAARDEIEQDSTFWDQR